MSNLTGTSTIVSLIILFLIGLYIFPRHVFFGRGSLRNSEAVHRYIVFLSGALFGIASFGFSNIDLQDPLSNNELFIALLMMMAGLVILVYGIYYLRSNLWDPLEQITEYSAEFGQNFIATRLPITGDIELQSFSERFNSNARNLADQISNIEIQLDKLENAISMTTQSGFDLASEIKGLGDIALNYNDLSRNQQETVAIIDENIQEFIEWYNMTQQNLRSNFIELRSLAELGNLIAVNAAVEAANMEEENPGISTLAEKLHDMARSLEDRQDNLRVILEEIDIRYEGFQQNIESNVNEAVKLSGNTVELGAEVESILRKVNQKEIDYNDNSNKVRNLLEKVDFEMPNAY